MNGKMIFYSGEQNSFIYEYVCTCGKKFRSTAMELDSVLCHRCYTGGHRGNKSRETAKGGIVTRKSRNFSE